MSQLFMLLIFFEPLPNRIYISMGPKMFDNVFHAEPGYVRARQEGPSWMKPKCILSSNQHFIHGSRFRLATTIGCSLIVKAALVSGVPRPILLSWSQQQLCQTSTKKEKEPLWCTTEKGSWKRWVGCSEQHTPRTICWLVTVWHFSLMWSIKHTKLDGHIAKGRMILMASGCDISPWAPHRLQPFVRICLW